ncbi:unnamed protein product [Rotaria sp. Silwood1]|nr:unnamed protein product [Rotaria sp. Silwood1]
MIKILHLNITSIKKHKDELLSRFSNDQLDKLGGGVLLAIKENIKCYEIFNKTIEKNVILAVKIETKILKSILTASIYVPSTVKIHLNVFHELYKMNNNRIIVGDLNAALLSMGSRKTNTRGRQLQEILK